MARDNYSFKKRAKELARKKKSDEKKQRKLDRKNAPAPSDQEQGASDVVPGETIV